MDTCPQFLPYIRQAVSKARKIIAISKGVAEEAIRRFPEAADKIETMIGGYDSWKFYPVDVTRESVLSEYGIREDPEFLLVSVGKLDQIKGVDYLLSAAAQYEKIYGNRIMTLIAGDGALSDELKAQAARLDLKSVRFLGHVPNNRLKRLYSVSDLCVIPARKDPLGAVAVEAMACGVPVVASNQGALTDVITPEVGTLIETGSVSDLVEGIRHELEYPNREMRRAAAARYAKERFSEDRILERMMGVYQTAENR